MSKKRIVSLLLALAMLLSLCACGQTAGPEEVTDTQSADPVTVTYMIGRHVDDAARYGRLQISDGRVTKFEEKGEAGAGIINAGCYIMPVHLLDGFPIGEAFSLEQDFLQRFVTEHDMRILVTTGMFIDIGVPKDYNKAQIVLKRYY